MNSDTLEREQGPADDRLTMGIDPWERNWMRISVILLVAFAVPAQAADRARAEHDRNVDKYIRGK